MQRRMAAGVIAGLAAGAVFGIMMQLMTAPGPEGARMPMMAMIARVVRSDSVAVGWAYHLFNSALIGAIFGAWVGRSLRGYGSAILWGAAYGLGWWVLGGLVLMPILLGMPPLAPVAMAPMRPVAMGSLVGHVVFGLILGVGFLVLRGRWSEEQATPVRRVA
jgi:hypothetical protein